MRVWNCCQCKMRINHLFTLHICLSCKPWFYFWLWSEHSKEFSPNFWLLLLPEIPFRKKSCGMSVKKGQVRWHWNIVSNKYISLISNHQINYLFIKNLMKNKKRTAPLTILHCKLFLLIFFIAKIGSFWIILHCTLPSFFFFLVDYSWPFRVTKSYERKERFCSAWSLKKFEVLWWKLHRYKICLFHEHGLSIRIRVLNLSVA